MSAKNSLDQYYTNPEYAKECYEKALKWATTRFCEPSNGLGAFGNQMPENALRFDLEPMTDDTIEQDFLSYEGSLLDYTVIGNPPFGRKSQMAVDFFNHCAELGAEVIAFVVPRSFRKANTQNKLDLHYELVLDETSPDKAFILNGNPYNVRCCFQVWKRIPSVRDILDVKGANPYFDYVLKSDDYDYIINRSFTSAGHIVEDDEGLWFPLYIKLTGCTKERFEEVHKSIDWNEVQQWDRITMESINKYTFSRAICQAFEQRTPVSTDATNEWFDFGNRKTADCAFFRNGGRAGEVVLGTNHSPSTVTFITTKKITPEQLREISLKMDRSAATNTPARNGMTSREFLDACLPFLEELNK